ncbi:septum formation inhibitor Maf [Marinomonas sp. M1K-6]|uniref:7-methyl-GTP pyrophosphatase n=1 Tax=Marinomonas profundi TaxID=2726122 RepID=A0A847R7M3_9GAMM|nr:nucleoside triphosphate pyrophosphatase [Marinomonas profundi]NLQ16270.1 septum formation inhibitor Maf [Marinomonas profundi]UDV03153.1 septum formation inhibitor Maf [Marinomonas profundi]
MQTQLILGSSSPYRKALLERLRIPFECHSPDIDESPLAQESAADLVKRLSIAKAFAVHHERLSNKKSTDAIIIASDQVAVLGTKILGKPLTENNAIKQLSEFSGKKVSFLTGLCVFNQQDQTYQYRLNEYHVYFRTLTEPEIIHYVTLEQPLDCAGSFKCEGLGVCLFDKMEGSDPNSLIGLPLISLCHLLRELNINPISTKIDNPTLN